MPDTLESDEAAFENLAFRLAGVAFAQNFGSSDDMLVSNRVLDIARRGIARAAKQRNNRTSLESAVPTEVLGLVFVHLDLKNCITVSQVCRLWRTVAFGTPALWTHVDTSWQGISYVLEQLERTGTLPLTIRVRRLTPALDGSLAKHMWHIKSLTFEYLWFSDDPCACLGSPAPVLDVLWFDFETEHNITRDRFPEHQVFPALRVLGFQVPSAKFCNIPSFLAMCPSLRKLEIDVWEPDWPHENLSLGLDRPITFFAPFLEEVRIWSGYEIFGSLLPHLDCVRDLRIGPWCADDDDGVTNAVSDLLTTPPDHIAVVRNDDLGRKNHNNLCILARSADWCRMLVPPRRREISWVMSDPTILGNLVSLVILVGQWLDAPPQAPAPALQSLTLILDSNRYGPVLKLCNAGQRPFHCPALRTVCVGDIYPLKRLPLVRLAAISRLLGDILGFTSMRRLPRLVIANALVEKASAVPALGQPQQWPSQTVPDSTILSETEPPEFVDHWEQIHDDHWDGLQMHG